MEERNAAQKKAADTRDADDWRHYKSLRNSATSRMKVEKRTWEREKLDNAEHDSGSLWKNVKSWLNWNNSGPPSQLFHNGEFINTPAGLAGTMNSFFIDKVAMLRDRIPQVNSDPLAKLRESMRNRKCTMKFRSVTPDEVLNIVKGLKNSKSTGVDYLDTWTIKLVAEDILPAITHIINLSIRQSKFPTYWKQAKVVPLLKKGDPLIPKNYRPVALLPILSKILEKAVFLQIVGYLDANKLLNPNHHGCRSGHSTATALIQMYDQWVEEVEAGQMVGVMMIDLSAAFDMVDHSLLLDKLRLFGMNTDVTQ
jgi:hypothetical protein